MILFLTIMIIVCTALGLKCGWHFGRAKVMRDTMKMVRDVFDNEY
jgi:predicted small metal-binding protein